MMAEKSEVYKSGKEYTISPIVSRRIELVRFFFMVLVVYIHSSALPVLDDEPVVPQFIQVIKKVVSGDIAAVAVPGFFIISSICLYSRPFSWADNIRKKIRTVVIPYVIINTFWMFFFKIMSLIPQTAAYFASDQYRIDTWQDVLNVYFGHHPLYYPFWFLQDLIILNLIASAIWFLFDRFPIATGLLCTYLASVPAIGQLFNNSECLVYWIIGMIIVKTGFSLERIDDLRVCDLSTAAVISTVLIYFGIIPMIIHVLIMFVFIYRMCSFAGHYCGKNRMLTICISQTFIIYAFHEFYEAMIKKILMILLPQTGVIQLLEYILLPIIIIAGCIAAGWCLERFLPAFYDVICGRRRIRTDS